ncbi:thioredoxin reductase [Pedobacter sp. UYP30]|uniref:NAD(P)/FAD-dependent oxidoreductase n=1 Tax=Pedobacter sp. UYP30 TaxID=1756400 RepID=UPI003393CB1B
MKNKNFDVIIIGGSYAGLSAAMALGRSLRNVLIIDSGLSCNRQTPYSHNFITQDGEKPSEITAKSKAQVLNYGTVNFLEDIAVSGKREENGFSIKSKSGKEFFAKKLIFATGIKDIMPDIKGFAECWGISMVHCPYCHGYELRNRKTGIMANGERAFHLASLVSNLTNDITILTSGKADFKPEQVLKLRNHNIKIIESEITEIKHHNGYVENVIFRDGNTIDFEGIYAALPFTQHSKIPFSLGCELTDQGYISVDGFQKTTLEGVYACGDNSTMMRSVANAVANGNLVGAMVNHELTEAQF